MEALSRESLSDLIGSIYDCLLDPSRWKGALQQVAQYIGCERVILSLSDLKQDRFLIDQAYGWDPHWLQRRRQHASEIHSVLNAWLAQHHDEDDPFIASRVLPPEAFAASAYVQQCLMPLGIRDVAHFFLLRTPEHFSDLALFLGGSAHTSGLLTDEQAQCGRLLLPHLRRAVTINKFLDITKLRCDRLTESLDTLSCAVFLVNERGYILHANSVGDSMLREGATVSCARGMLTTSSAQATHELKDAIAVSAVDLGNIGTKGLSICLSSEPPLVLAHVLPLRSRGPLSRPADDAVAIVFVRTDDSSHDNVDIVSQAFGFTPAETRVLRSLLTGKTLQDVAEELRVSRTTVKTHLDSIFNKTGVARQVDLVRLASGAAIRP